MKISVKNLLKLPITEMTHFIDRPNIEEMTEMMYRDELEELLESDDSQWDLNMDDESNDFESYLGSTYDY